MRNRLPVYRMFAALTAILFLSVSGRGYSQSAQLLIQAGADPSMVQRGWGSAGNC